MQESRLASGDKPESLTMAAAGLPFFPGLGAGGFFQRGAPPTDFQARAYVCKSLIFRQGPMYAIDRRIA
jgi:hypothetical protein